MRHLFEIFCSCRWKSFLYKQSLYFITSSSSIVFFLFCKKNVCRSFTYIFFSMLHSLCWHILTVHSITSFIKKWIMKSFWNLNVEYFYIIINEVFCWQSLKGNIKWWFNVVISKSTRYVERWNCMRYLMKDEHMKNKRNLLMKLFEFIPSMQRELC